MHNDDVKFKHDRYFFIHHVDTYYKYIYSQICFKRPSIQVTWKSILTGGGLLLNERSAESSFLSFLHYFHAAIMNHLFENPKICLVLFGGLTQV